MIKAVLFDMDGVIIDSEPLHKRAYFRMFEEVGIAVSEELYNSFTGQSTLDVCTQLVDQFNLKKDPQELIEIKRAQFKKLFKSDPNLDLIQGVRELIEEYHVHGIKLVLASSASMTTIDNVFDRFDLDQYFVAKLSGAELKASKPHPEIFIKAAEASGVKRSECIVIEDSTNGIKAAHAAGITCIAYKSSHSKDQNYDLANLVISSYKDIGIHQLENIEWK